jgi:glycine cleavage system H lipoate-binding protein
MVILLVFLFAAIAISITWYRGMKRYQALSVSPIVKKPAYQFKMENLRIPSGVYFSPTHSWAHLETNGRAKIGVDTFIQGLTGVLSAIDVPENGSTLKQGDPLFSIIHKNKKLVISAPVSGKVRSINMEALQNMRMVHRDPYSFGWLVEMEPSDWENETKHLYLGDRTIAWLKIEMARIRDFFALSSSPLDSESGLALLQSGGDIAECALAFSDKDLWGLFQKLILDQANIELNPSS